MSPAALAGLAEAANGSAMLAARQAAAAQLEQFRAEMVAEAAKMRAAVERQVSVSRAYHIGNVRLVCIRPRVEPNVHIVWEHSLHIVPIALCTDMPHSQACSIHV